MGKMVTDIGYADDWVGEMRRKLQRGDRSDPHIKEVFALEKEGVQPIDVVRFAKTERASYNGEVGKKGTEIIFHFFPKDGITFLTSSLSKLPFEEVMGDAFIDVFKFEERIQAAYSEELHSWAVKVAGYGDNPAVDTLCLRLFDAIDRLMKL